MKRYILSRIFHKILFLFHIGGR